MIYTTLNRIRKHRTRKSEWETLLKHLGKTVADDEQIALSTVLASNGITYALWCLRSVPEENARWRLLAVRFARNVEHLMKDPRSLKALEVTELHAQGRATDQEFETAHRNAYAAANAAAAAAAAAAYAYAAYAYAAYDAAAAAANAAANAAAYAAAYDYAGANAAAYAYAAYDAADAAAAAAAAADTAAADTAAYAAARTKQAEQFLAILEEVL